MAATTRAQRMWGLIRPYRRALLGLLGLTALLSGLGMLPPLLTRHVIDGVLTRGQTDLFAPLAAALLIVPALAVVVSYVQQRWIAYVGQRLVLALRASLFDHYLDLSLRFFHRHSTGKLVSRLMEDSAAVQNMVTASSAQVLSDLVAACISVGVTFVINVKLALLLLVVVAAFVLNYRLNVARIRHATRRFRGSQDRLAGGLTNRLTAGLTVKTYGMESREHSAFQRESDEATWLFEQSVAAHAGFGMNTAFLQGASHALVFFAGCALVLRGSATYGDVVAFTAYTMQLLWPAVRFSLISQQLQDVRISAGRLFEYLETEPEIVSRPRARSLRRVEGRVDFDRVDFFYTPGEPVLRAFDIHVPAGHSVALVGPTGCGKTTVLSLLMRFYDVQGGAVRLDGMDVRDIALPSLRRQFGIVLQESQLFNVTVAENIRYSNPAAEMQAVIHAAQAAEIHDEILALPQGYDTLLGSRGVELSIGQKQRLNIARAVLVDPPVLIMDEATSALDSESERAIQAAMGRFLRGRTSFIVAHRLSTIRDADTIVMMDAGSIVETGSHAMLMARGGRYRALYEKHAGRGILEEI
jgi:ATP-binding cassette, subfamily B, bacterial MsbA